MYSNECSGGVYGVYPFAGVASFLRMPELNTKEAFEKTDFDIGVLGIPYDEGMPFIPGVRFAPRAFREQSLRYNKNGVYSVEEDKVYLRKELQEDRIADLGDVAITPTAIPENWASISDAVRSVLRKRDSHGNQAMLVCLGGDHSVTAPILAGFDALGESFHVMHFDSHPDYSSISEGFQYTNAHPFRWVNTYPYVKSITQVGIRSVRAFQTRDSRADGHRVIGMKEYHEMGGAEAVAATLPEGEPVYISFDIDALDASLVPGCTSAEPNGFTYQEMRENLQAVAKHSRVVGFDIVCVNPLIDTPNKITSYIGLQLIMEFLGTLCDQPYWKARYLK